MVKAGKGTVAGQGRQAGRRLAVGGGTTAQNATCMKWHVYRAVVKCRLPHVHYPVVEPESKNVNAIQGRNYECAPEPLLLPKPRR